MCNLIKEAYPCFLVIALGLVLEYVEAQSRKMGLGELVSVTGIIPERRPLYNYQSRGMSAKKFMRTSPKGSGSRYSSPGRES